MAFNIDIDGELKLEDPDEQSKGPESAQGRPADFSKSEESGRYTGPERRRYHRRSGSDRRDDLRFESKADRRSGKDRRKGIWDPKYTI